MAALGAHQGVFERLGGGLGRPGRVLGRLGGVLGGDLGASGGVLGVSWDELRRLLGHPRGSWDVLGASWA